MKKVSDIQTLSPNRKTSRSRNSEKRINWRNRVHSFLRHEINIIYAFRDTRMKQQQERMARNLNARFSLADGNDVMGEYLLLLHRGRKNNDVTGEYLAHFHFLHWMLASHWSWRHGNGLRNGTNPCYRSQFHFLQNISHSWTVSLLFSVPRLFKPRNMALQCV